MFRYTFYIIFDFETTDENPTIKMSTDEVLKTFLAAKDNWDEITYGIVVCSGDSAKLQQMSKSNLETFILEFVEDNKWTDEYVPEQVRSFFTTWCFIYHIDADTLACDKLLGSVYARGSLSSCIKYDDFENFMVSFII